jgi:hypothetical protein
VGHQVGHDCYDDLDSTSPNMVRGVCIKPAPLNWDTGWALGTCKDDGPIVSPANALHNGPDVFSYPPMPLNLAANVVNTCLPKPQPARIAE